MNTYSSRCINSIKEALSSFVSGEDGFMRISGSAPQLLPGTASFSIVRTDDIPSQQMIAPAGVWLRATNFVGFDVSEPGGTDNQYDPTQREITFIWSLPDEGYVPETNRNLPIVWRNRNIAYGKQICHVFTTPGTKVVTCFAFDRSGNWATAEHVFGPDGQSGPIIDPDVYFAGANTIYFSQEGIFPNPLPPGSQTTTSTSDLISKLTARLDAGAPLARAMLRRGEVYNLTGGITTARQGRGTHVGVYGSGPRPILNYKKNTVLGWRDAVNSCVAAYIDVRGDWDSTTETGFPAEVFSNTGMYVNDILLHGCRFSGFNTINFSKDNGEWRRIVSDCEITNWKNYGILGTGNLVRLGVIDSDIAQHVDALNGINQGRSRQEPTNLGNLHGPLRITGFIRDTYIARTSFFSRNAWSLSQNTGYINGAPTAEQDCIRFATNPSGFSTDRHHHIWERCSFEGGYAGNIQLSGNGDYNGGVRNILLDKCLFIAGSMSGEFSGTRFFDVTFRNCYGFLPNLTRRGWNDGGTGSSSFGSNSEGFWVHNCTIVNQRQDGSGPQDPSQAPFRANGIGGISENNIYWAPFKMPAIGQSLAPLSMTTMQGVSCRNKGQRFNFPPIGGVEGSVTGNFKGPFSASSLRELGPGDIAPGEWMAVDYPNYTGLCNGAGMQVTQALIQALPSQKHQVSLTIVSSKRMGDADIWSEADDRVKFDFTPTKIRIQNNTSSIWAGNNNVWIQLDLSSHLMPPVAVTSSFGQTVPVPAPGAGSSARIDSKTGRWAYDDFFGIIRKDELNTSGALVTSGFYTQGAFT
jgi:hypothetical protein